MNLKRNIDFDYLFYLCFLCSLTLISKWSLGLSCATSLNFSRSVSVEPHFVVVTGWKPGSKNWGKLFCTYSSRLISVVLKVSYGYYVEVPTYFWLLNVIFHVKSRKITVQLCRLVNNTNSKCVYRASRLVVVPIHRWASVWTVLSGVCKLPGHQHPKLCILAAATPLPALPWRALVVGVAPTHGRRALGAWTCHCKCNARWSYSVDECWLSGCWKRRTKTDRKTEKRRRKGSVSIW